MVFSIEIYDEAPSDWNNFLLQTNSGTIFNSVEYANYAPLEGYKPRFLRITDSSGKIALQNLLLEYNPGIKKIPKIFHKIYRKFRTVSRWNYGPVADTPEPIEAFFNHLRENHYNFYGVTHPLSKIDEIRFQKQKWGTFLINLQKSEEELFSNIDKKSGRKNIERSIERNVSIEEITEETLREYASLLNQTKSAAGRGEETSLEDMNEGWRLLKPAGFSGFLARKDGIVIGGLLFSFFNNYINEWGVARSQIDYDEKLYSQDLIKWKIIEWGVEHKMRWYDLSGFNPEPSSEKEKGILRYKEKWGGEKYLQWIIRS